MVGQDQVGDVHEFLLSCSRPFSVSTQLPASPRIYRKTIYFLRERVDGQLDWGVEQQPGKKAEEKQKKQVQNGSGCLWQAHPPPAYLLAGSLPLPSSRYPPAVATSAG
jgi:hypothetical protein